MPKHRKPVPEKYVIAKVEMLIINGENEEAISILESYLERYPSQEKGMYLLDAAKKSRA